MTTLDDDHVHQWTGDARTSCPQACKDAAKPCGTRRSADATDPTVCGRFHGHSGPHTGWDGRMHLADWS